MLKSDPEDMVLAIKELQGKGKGRQTKISQKYDIPYELKAKDDLRILKKKFFSVISFNCNNPVKN